MIFSDESAKGCRSFKANNIIVNKPLRNDLDGFVTRWQFTAAEIFGKCPISCPMIGKPGKCVEHAEKNMFPSIVKEFRGRVGYLIRNANNKNLVCYTAIKCDSNNSTLNIYLLQEYVEGVSLYELCKQNKLPNVGAFANDAMQAIKHLHSLNHITHGYLRPESIFLDASGKFRIADFDVIPYLTYLKGNHKMHETSDLEAFGTIIKSLNDLIFTSTNDFVEQCCSGRVSNYSKLFDHPLIRSVSKTEDTIGQTNDETPETPETEKIIFENFEFEENLGYGRFGDVLKVKNHSDEKSYAIKVIKIPSGSNSKKEIEQLDREAEIISSIDHKYVVRCITYWKQKMDMHILNEYTNGDGSSRSTTSSTSSSSLE